jgi:hypothetical protein
MGFIFYKYLASRKQGKLNKPIEELQTQSGMPKKKKNQRSGNNKNNSIMRKCRNMCLFSIRSVKRMEFCLLKEMKGICY